MAKILGTFGFASTGAIAVNLALAVIFVTSLAGCGVKTVRREGESETASANVTSAEVTSSETASEISLKADRSELDKFRTEIPEEVKRQNDEIALILSFINRETEEDPNKVRDRFSSALRKRREASDKHLRRTRESFSKREKQEREDFLKRSKDERTDFLDRKRSPDDRKRFFEDQEDKRKVFFADQTEKRKDFESSVQEERKRMEDFVREKQNQFNQEWRDYLTRYTERKKQNDLKKRMEQKARELERRGQPVPKAPDQPTGQLSPSVPSDALASSIDTSNSVSYSRGTLTSSPEESLKEFDSIPQGPGVPLTPGTAKKGN